MSSGVTWLQADCQGRMLEGSATSRRRETMRRPNQSDENTEVEFRIVEVRVRGGNAAVIDSLRTMAGAFSAKPKQLPPRGISAAVTEKENDSPQEELNFGDDAAPEPMPMAEGSSRTQR